MQYLSSKETQTHGMNNPSLRFHFNLLNSETKTYFWFRFCAVFKFALQWKLDHSRYSFTLGDTSSSKFLRRAPALSLFGQGYLLMIRFKAIYTLITVEWSDNGSALRKNEN